jgi:hypothetical protein
MAYRQVSCFAVIIRTTFSEACLSFVFFFLLSSVFVPRPETNIAVVTHAGFFGMGIGAHLMKDATEEEKLTLRNWIRIDNAAVRTCEIWMDHDGTIHIARCAE